MKKLIIIVMLLAIFGLGYLFGNHIKTLKAAQYSNIPTEDIWNNVYTSGASPTIRISN